MFKGSKLFLTGVSCILDDGTGITVLLKTPGGAGLGWAGKSGLAEVNEAKGLAEPPPPEGGGSWARSD